MHQHIQALCCLSKDPFQQILCRGVLHERASLGCFPERHAQTHGHVKDSSFVEGRGFSIYGDHYFHLVTQFLRNSSSFSIFRARNFGTRRKGTESFGNFLSRLKPNACTAAHAFMKWKKLLQWKNNSQVAVHLALVMTQFVHQFVGFPFSMSSKAVM